MPINTDRRQEEPNIFSSMGTHIDDYFTEQQTQDIPIEATVQTDTEAIEEEPLQDSPPPIEVPIDVLLDPPSEKKEKQQTNIGGFISDIGRGVVSGVSGELDSNIELIGELGNRIGISNTIGNNVIGDIEERFAPEGSLGSAVKGITQFATAFIGVGKFFQVSKLGKLGISAVDKAVKGNEKTKRVVTHLGGDVVKGGIADFIGFGGKDDRLVDIFKGTPYESWIPDFLARDKDDEELEGRFKTAMEGAVIGGTANIGINGFIRLMRSIRKVRQGFNQGGEEKAYNIIQKETKNITEAVNEVDPPSPVVPKAVKTTPVKKPKTKSKPTIDKDFLVDEKSFGKLITNVGFADSIELKNYFNYSKLTSSKETHIAIDGLTDLYKGKLDQLSKNNKKSFDEMQREASVLVSDYLDRSPEALIGAMEAQAMAAKESTAFLLAGRTLMQGMAEATVARAKHFRKVGGTEAEEAQIIHLAMLTGDVLSSVKAIGREAARTTASGRIPLGANSLDNILRALKEGDIEGKELIEKLSIADTPLEAAKVIDAYGKRGFDDIAFGLFANSILSGPSTHIINTTSGLINSFLFPMERAVGSLFRGNLADAESSLQSMYYVLESVNDANKFMFKALKEGSFILDPTVSKVDRPEHSITQVFRSDSGIKTLDSVVNTAGNVFGIPLRVLGAEDEWLKQINYRASLKAKLYSQSKKVLGEGATAKDRAEYIEGEFKKGFNEFGEGIDTEALEYARESTFTTKLRGRSHAKQFQNWVFKTPILKYFNPFIRTPYNLMRAVGQRTPLIQHLSKQMQEDWAAGGVRKSHTIGKVASGYAMWATAAGMAMSGRLTGSAPVNRAEAEIKRMSGWRPYSLVTEDDDGNKIYTSYRRLDPFGIIFGLAVDSTQLISEMTDDQLEETDQMVGTILTIFANTVTDKTFYVGILDFAQALNQPDRKAEAALSRLGSAFVPKIYKDVDQVIISKDPYIREARSFMDSLVKGTTIGTEELPPRINWISGEPIVKDSVNTLGGILSPYKQSRIPENNIVLDELARTGYGWLPPSEEMEGIELTPEQYHDYLELHGKTRIGKYTLQDRLLLEFSKSDYDIGRQRIPDAIDPETSHRKAIIDKWIHRYRKQAKKHLLRKYPGLRRQIRERNKLIKRSTKRRGDLEALQQLVTTEGN